MEISKDFKITDKQGFVAVRHRNTWFPCSFHTDETNENVRVISEMDMKVYACNMAYQVHSYRIFDNMDNCQRFCKSKNEEKFSEARVREEEDNSSKTNDNFGN